MQICRCPLLKAVEFDLTWLEHDAFAGIDAANHQVVLVDVNRDVATPDLNGGAVMLHSLYRALERWGAVLWAERITHRYEPDQLLRVISDATIRREVK